MRKLNGILLVQYLLCAFFGIVFLAEGAVSFFNNVSNQSLSSKKKLDAYRLSAEEGDSDAQYHLGKAFLQGIGTEQDFNKAVKWLFHARQNGSYKAELELSKIRKKVATFSDPNEVMEIIFAFQEIANDFHTKYPEIKKPEELNETTGTILFFGEGRADEALDLLIQEAYLLRAPAQIMLRLIYKYGLENKFVPYDPRILAHYQRVVGDGIPRDQFYLAEMYYYELGVERDVQYARKLVENNSLEDAQELLFAIYYEQEEKELAEEITRQAADNDYSWGAYNYGVLMIEKGNHKEAVEYFHKTLEIDPEYWEAMLNLGQAYIEGWGVEEDPLKGFLFYKNVADDGPEGEKATLIGLHVTGMLYLEGIGISKDSELGIAYLKKSASGGYEKSKQFLADYNRDDSKNTFEEWKELAKQGNTEAQARLGLMHQFGWEASQDHVEAVKWFRLAAEQGDARSQYNLGWMFSKGKGVSLDFAQAHMWFNLAEANGYKDGRKKRILIENKMTPEQIAEAQKLAKEWEQKSWEEILASNDFPDMKKRFSEDNKTENLNLASKAPHESNSEKSVSVVSEKWEHKDWATNYYPDMGLVRFISHGLILYSHQFGFIKQSGNCDTDILWISWPAYDEKVKIFEGKEMTLKMDVDGTSFEIPIELLVLNTIFRDSMIMNFTNSSGESQFTDLIKKGKKVTVSIVGPENFEEYLGALSPSFSLNGFIANQLKAKEFCEKQEVNTRNKLTKEKKV